ncbi:hypothetical protein M407DRAFT_246451 [Tulasnella calospora MUT 4182]|uniref:NAD(P)-binding protein n=1 Tax=Tulasnella calospora MUT 4182 TaxID=1051891 RepID=A0A0C3KAW8_9AGAM|nr:hypothetical protein M407DRAFT_246451 [Tulasnella calospora MUT 4182]
MSGVAFIVGFGKGVGSAVAAKFKSEGFAVAVASRSLVPGEVEKEHGYLGVKLDASQSDQVAAGFARVEKAIGPANVVVYNASAFASAPGGKADPLSLSGEDFLQGVSVGGIGAYYVAQHANGGFTRLENTSHPLPPRVFIATGNALPWVQPPLPHLLGVSTGKKALANIVESCATAYADTGKRFYYAYEVSPQGGLVRSPDPSTHAKVFWGLYNLKEQGDWAVKFTKE